MVNDERQVGEGETGFMCPQTIYSLAQIDLTTFNGA